MDTLNITRLSKEKVESDRANIMANRTFVVALLMNKPYTMLKQEARVKLNAATIPAAAPATRITL